MKKLLVGLIGFALYSADTLAMNQRFICSEKERTMYIDSIKNEVDKMKESFFMEQAFLNGEAGFFVSTLLRMMSSDMRKLMTDAPLLFSRQKVEEFKKNYNAKSDKDFVGRIWQDPENALFPKFFQLEDRGKKTSLHDFLSYHLEKGNGQILLDIASRAGCPTIIKWLIAKGVDASAPFSGRTALMNAIWRNNFESVDLLLPLSDLKWKAPDGHTSFMLAVKFGKPKVVKHLHIFLKNMEERDQEGNTILMLANYNNDANVYNYILQNSNPRAVNNSGDSVLGVAVEYKTCDKVKILLSNEQVDPNLYGKDRKNDKYGLSPIEKAVIYNNTDALNLLLGHKKIKLESEYFCPEILLHIAVLNGNNDMVKILLEHCGYRNRYEAPENGYGVPKNDYEQNLIEKAEELENLQNEEIISAVVSSTLYTAIIYGYTDIVKSLLACDKVDINHDTTEYFMPDLTYYYHRKKNYIKNPFSKFYKKNFDDGEYADLYRSLRNWVRLGDNKNTPENSESYRECFPREQNMTPFRFLLEHYKTNLDDIFNLFIKNNKFDKNYVDGNKNTYLHIAIEKNLKGPVYEMLQNGFAKCITTKNKKEETPVDIATRYGWNTLANQLLEMSQHNRL